MLHLNLIRVRSPEEMARAAADMFEDLIRAKPACVLGLATGSTPLPLYRELIAREQGGKIDFSRVRSANLDEYKGLAPNQPQSYRRFMQENLFDHISIKPENTIVPDGLAADIPAMCEAYEHQIEDWGGVDIQLLGLGHDGPCHGFRYFFRHGHADAFRDELPEDERQVGDGDDDNRFGDAVSVWGQHLRACDDDREVGGESFARIETGQNADERDADLYGGQEPVRFAGECEGCAGGLAAAAGFRLQPRPARRYQCYLGHRKDAVQNNQQQDDNDFHS